MKRPSTFLHQRPSMEVQMTPMIDMVFLLLIYFICNAGFQTPEQSLASSLEVESQGATVIAAPPAKPELLSRLVVGIHWSEGDPSWTIDSEPVASLAAVSASLKSTARVKRDVAVVIQPDAGVPLSHAIDIYDLAKRAGLVQVHFAILSGGEKKQ